MSKRSKHQKVGGYPSGTAERLTPPPESAQSMVVHDAEVQIPGLKPLIEQAGSYTYAMVDQGLPPYSPLTQDELNVLKIGDLQADLNYSRHEHGLTVRRIANQRRELRNLNRAYRRRENENVRRITMLKDQLKISIRATTLRNQKIEDQQREIDELRRQLNVSQNGGRRKRTVRWPRG